MRGEQEERKGREGLFKTTVLSELLCGKEKEHPAASGFNFTFFLVFFLFHAFMRSLLWIKQTPPTVTLFAPGLPFGLFIPLHTQTRTHIYTRAPILWYLSH